MSQLALLQILKSQSVAEAVTASGVQHPYPTVAHKWYQVKREFLSTLDALRDAKTGSNASAESLLGRWTSVLYRGAEFVETLEKHVTRPLDIKFKLSRALDRQLSEQCNALKHDAARIGRVEAKAPHAHVVGYQIQHVRGGSLGPVERLHKKRTAFSFNLEMRKHLAALLCASDEAAEAVRLKFNEPATSYGEGNFPLGERVLALPLYVFPSEARGDIPLLRRDKATILVRTSGGTVIPLVGTSIQLTASFTADGFTRSFDLPRLV